MIESPIYKETIEKETKPLLREVLKIHDSITESGVYLKHLQIRETILVYREQLDDMLNWMKRFEFSKIEATLVEIHDNAKQMIEYMKKEYELQEVLEETVTKTKDLMHKLQEHSEKLNEQYENIKDNYRLPEDEESNFNFLINEIQIVSNEFTYLLGKVDEHQRANSVLLRDVSSIYQQLEEINEQLDVFDGEIESLYAGEKECRQRALYLLKTFNHLKGMYQRNPFTS